MATIKYFSGTQEVASIRPIRNAQFAAMFPGATAKRWDSFSRIVGQVGAELLPVTRAIEYKSNPSLHKCDARCQSAKGRKCECACGGKYHGQVQV